MMPPAKPAHRLRQLKGVVAPFAIYPPGFLTLILWRPPCPPLASVGPMGSLAAAGLARRLAMVPCAAVRRSQLRHPGGPTTGPAARPAWQAAYLKPAGGRKQRA